MSGNSIYTIKPRFFRRHLVLAGVFCVASFVPLIYLVLLLQLRYIYLVFCCKVTQFFFFTVSLISYFFFFYVLESTVIKGASMIEILGMSFSS